MMVRHHACGGCHQHESSNGCSRLRHFKIVELLLANGAGANSEDSLSGRTPLHHACREGYIDVVELLIEKKVNVDDTDTIGPG
jgi:ankyrin repeat protein